MSRTVRLVIVVAVAENGVIGRAGALPWRLKSDLQHFRRVTMGKPIVMGRKTFASIGRALPGRTNIVVSRCDFAADGVVTATSLDLALEVARADALRRGGDEIAFIGGAEIFAQMIDRASRVIMTRVHASPPGDTLMPPLAADWVETAKCAHAAAPGDEAPFDILVYERALQARR